MAYKLTQGPAVIRAASLTLTGTLANVLGTADGDVRAAAGPGVGGVRLAGDVHQGLADQKFISPNALDSSRTALDAARAGLDAAQAQLSTARVSLRDAALVAPIAGLVSKRHVVPGEKLAMEQPVLTLVDLATLELAGTVGTHEVALLAPGMPDRPLQVIDARDFLTDPEGYQRWVCDWVGIDFDPAMLSWPAGPRDSDGVWAPHWYDAVWASTHFAPHRRAR